MTAIGITLKKIGILMKVKLIFGKKRPWHLLLNKKHNVGRIHICKWIYYNIFRKGSWIFYDEEEIKLLS